MKTNLIGVSAVTLLMLSACSPESNTLVRDIPAAPAPSAPAPKPQATPFPQMSPPPEVHVNVTKPKWITLDGGQNKLEFNPQVDIIFVIDNSDSMRSAEANLVKNIDRFSEGIVKNKMIDYHIGVISTWDSSARYAASPARQDSYQIGDLRFIKDSKGQKFGQRFLTRKEDKSLLSSTLKIGVVSFAEGGPETEEFFSPLASALDKTGRGASNEGFFREHSQLVVVFMTDADDSTSQFTPAQMAEKLVAFKGGRADKVTVYGALVRASDADENKDWDLRVHPKYHPECFDMSKKPARNIGSCKGFGPERLEQLIMLANASSGTAKEIRDNNIMSIVSKNFGTDLAKIGANITVKTLTKEISLSPYRPFPDEKTGKWQLRVRYGLPADLEANKGIEIQQNEKAGWRYDQNSNSILLAGDIKAYEQAPEGSAFAVDILVVPEAQ